MSVCVYVFSMQPDSHYTIVEPTQQERQQQAQQRYAHLKSFALNQVVYGTDCSSLLEGCLKDFQFTSHTVKYRV